MKIVVQTREDSYLSQSLYGFRSLVYFKCRSLFSWCLLALICLEERSLWLHFAQSWCQPPHSLLPYFHASILDTLLSAAFELILFWIWHIFKYLVFMNLFDKLIFKTYLWHKFCVNFDLTPSTDFNPLFSLGLKFDVRPIIYLELLKGIFKILLPAQIFLNHIIAIRHPR